MTKQEIKAKINKLENGIKSKATPSNLIAPLKAQKAKFEKELEELETAEKKAVKTKKVSKVAEKIKAAKTSVAKKTPAKAPVKEERKKDNIARDGDRKSLPAGKRISKSGKVYYETRANRSDKQTSKKPYLVDGGKLTEKYNVSFNYNPSNLNNEEAEKIVSAYTKDWRHNNDFDEVSFYVFGLIKENADMLVKQLKMEDAYNIEVDKSNYAKGGELNELKNKDMNYAKGGDVKKHKVVTSKESYADDLLKYADLQNIPASSKMLGNKFIVTFDSIPKVMDSMTQDVKNLVNKMALGGMMAKGGVISAKKRLEELRKELRAESLSYGELVELQSLSKYIDKGDVELLEAAGVPEFDENEMALGGMMADGGKTKSRKSMKDLTIEQISSMTGVGKAGVEKFSDDNNLTEDDLSNIMQGLGRRMISASDFATAILGEKDNQYTKEIVDFAKLGKGYKMADGGKVSDIDMAKVESAAKFYTDESRWSTKPTIDKFEAEIKEKESLKTKLDNKQITPSKIIGSGIKSSLARPLAYKWLKEQILIAKRAIEMLKEKDKMEKGGYMADGGKIENSYRGLSTYDLWNKWSTRQRIHFFEDHRDKYSDNDVLPKYTNAELADMIFDKLPSIVQSMIYEHRIDGQYAYGGYMADGGMMAKGGDIADIGGEIYAMAENMTDAEYVKKLSGLNEKQKRTYESLVRLGDSPKLALATTLLSNKVKYDDDTIRAYTMANGGFTQYGEPMGFEEESDSVYEIHHKPNYNSKNPYLIWDKIDGVYIAEFPNRQRALHYIYNKSLGMMADGGKIKNQYQGKSPEYFWNNMTQKQREHFVDDHKLVAIDDYRVKLSFDELPNFMKKEIGEHYKMGQYDDGGMMAKGGEVPTHFGSGKNIEVFGYETKNFDICATAVKEFEVAIDIMKDSKDMEKESLAYCAKYVDNLFGIEKVVVEGGIGGELNFSHAVSDIMSAATYNFKAGMPINLYSFVPQHLMEIALRLAKAEKGGLYDLGGMTAGRFYKDKSGEEFKFIGRVDSGANKGRFLFTDGQKSVYKDLEDFEGGKPKENKLFSFFADGGKIKNQYQGKSPDYIWNNMTQKQREHFVHDHKLVEIDDYRVKLSFDELPNFMKKEIGEHYKMGQYDDGGMMADGGEMQFVGITDDEGNLIDIKVGDEVVEYIKRYTNQEKEQVGGKGRVISINAAFAKVSYGNDYEKFVALKKLKKMASGGMMAKGGKVKDAEYAVSIESEDGETYDWDGFAKSEDDAIYVAEQEAGFQSVSSSVNMITDENGNKIDAPEYATGGEVEAKINKLYQKTNFINDDFSWETKLLEMLQDGSSESYDIYQSLTKNQKEDVLQTLFEMDNDFGMEGDGDIETSKENLEILLEDGKAGSLYADGGMMAKGGMMADGGEVSNPYEEFLLENGFRKSFEVKNEKFTEYRKGRWYCFIDKKRKEIEVGKYDLDYSDADVKKYGAIREDDAPLYHSDRYTNSFTKFKKFLDNYYILDDKMASGGMMAKGGKLKIGGEDFSYLLELSDKELSKRLDLVRKQQDVNGKQYFEAKSKNESTQKIEDSRKNLDNQERAIIEARARKMVKGGTTKFADKVKAVQESLLKRKKVAPQVQKDYGKTYSKAEAQESAKRIVGSRYANLKDKMSKMKK